MIDTAKPMTVASTDGALHRAWAGLCRIGRNFWSMIRGRHVARQHPPTCYDVE